MSAVPVEFLLNTLWSAGVTIAGGRVYTYAAGSTTPKVCWEDKDKATSYGAYIPLDANGTALAFADGEYKFVIKDASGATIYTRDGLMFDSGRTAVSSGDTTQDFLTSKLLAGANITLTKNNAGANETLTVAAAGAVVIGENILPNTQHEVITAFVVKHRYNAAGTADEPALAIASYTENVTDPVCLCSNTGNLADGDFVIFSSPAGGTMRVSGNRVYNLVTNTSFQITLPRNLNSGTTAACDAYSIQAGSYGETSGHANDGWTKTTTLEYWRDMWPANIKTGHCYAGGFKKGANTAETYYRNIPLNETKIYRGQNLVFGAWLRQDVKGSTGTARLFISQTAGSATVYSTSVVSLGTYEYLQVTAAIASTATQISVGVSFEGVTGDIYRQCGAHCQRGTVLSSGAYMQSKNERLVPVVDYTPYSFHITNVVFPTVVDVTGVFYSFPFDLAAETGLAFAPSVNIINMQAEGINTNVAESFAFRDQLAAGMKFGIFPIKSQVTGVQVAVGGEWTLAPDGTGVIYSDASGSSWSFVSFDINGAILNASR